MLSNVHVLGVCSHFVDSTKVVKSAGASKACRKHYVLKMKYPQIEVFEEHDLFRRQIHGPNPDAVCRKNASTCLIHIVSFPLSFRYLCYMSSIVISPKSQKELQFISELLSKLGVRSKVLSDAELEDLGLAVMMKDVDRSEVVGEDEIMQKLKVS